MACSGENSSKLEEFTYELGEKIQLSLSYKRKHIKKKKEKSKSIKVYSVVSS